MDNPPCTCTPNPPAEWVSGVCVKCWHWKYTPSFRKGWARRGKKKSETVIKLKIKLDANGKATAEGECGEANPRHGRRCKSLGKRSEQLAGCGGWMCKHACDSTREDVAEFLGRIPLAVPGEDCQGCPGFVDGGKF